MVIVDVSLVVLVARYTREGAEDLRLRVTVQTLDPGTLVCSGVDGEEVCVMVEIKRVGVVAIQTSGWKSIIVVLAVVV
jgi:hypothetical protein